MIILQPEEKSENDVLKSPPKNLDKPPLQASSSSSTRFNFKSASIDPTSSNYSYSSPHKRDSLPFFINSKNTIPLQQSQQQSKSQNQQKWPFDLKHFPPSIYDSLSTPEARKDMSKIRFSSNIATSDASKDYPSAATPEMFIAYLTSPDILNYDLISDFFLTYRLFLDPFILLELVFSRLAWAIEFDNNTHHPSSSQTLPSAAAAACPNAKVSNSKLIHSKSHQLPLSNLNNCTPNHSKSETTTQPPASVTSNNTLKGKSRITISSSSSSEKTKPTSDKLNENEFGRDVAVRTFVLIRHWILNFFADDFVPHYDLRVEFARLVNALYSWPPVQQNATFLHILTQLKKSWLRSCSLFWDEFNSNQNSICTNDGNNNAVNDDAHKNNILPGGSVGSCTPTRTNSLISQASIRRTTILSLYKKSNTQLPSTKPLITDPQPTESKVKPQHSETEQEKEKTINNTAPSDIQQLWWCTSLIRGALDPPLDAQVSSILPPTPEKFLKLIPSAPMALTQDIDTKSTRRSLHSGLIPPKCSSTSLSSKPKPTTTQSNNEPDKEENDPAHSSSKHIKLMVEKWKRGLEHHKNKVISRFFNKVVAHNQPTLKASKSKLKGRQSMINLRTRFDDNNEDPIQNSNKGKKSPQTIKKYASMPSFLNINKPMHDDSTPFNHNSFNYLDHNDTQIDILSARTIQELQLILKNNSKQPPPEKKNAPAAVSTSTSPQKNQPNQTAKPSTKDNAFGFSFELDNLDQNSDTRRHTKSASFDTINSSSTTKDFSGQNESSATSAGVGTMVSSAMCMNLSFDSQATHKSGQFLTVSSRPSSRPSSNISAFKADAPIAICQPPNDVESNNNDPEISTDHVSFLDNLDIKSQIAHQISPLKHLSLDIKELDVTKDEDDKISLMSNPKCPNAPLLNGGSFQSFQSYDSYDSQYSEYTNPVNPIQKDNHASPTRNNQPRLGLRRVDNIYNFRTKLNGLDKPPKFRLDEDDDDTTTSSSIFSSSNSLNHQLARISIADSDNQYPTAPRRQFHYSKITLSAYINTSNSGPLSKNELLNNHHKQIYPGLGPDIINQLANIPDEEVPSDENPVELALQKLEGVYTKPEEKINLETCSIPDPNEDQTDHSASTSKKYTCYAGSSIFESNDPFVETPKSNQKAAAPIDTKNEEATAKTFDSLTSFNNSFTKNRLEFCDTFTPPMDNSNSSVSFNTSKKELQQTQSKGKSKPSNSHFHNISVSTAFLENENDEPSCLPKSTKPSFLTSSPTQLSTYFVSPPISSIISPLSSSTSKDQHISENKLSPSSPDEMGKFSLFPMCTNSLYDEAFETPTKLRVHTSFDFDTTENDENIDPTESNKFSFKRRPELTKGKSMSSLFNSYKSNSTNSNKPSKLKRSNSALAMAQLFTTDSLPSSPTKKMKKFPKFYSSASSSTAAGQDLSFDSNSSPTKFKFRKNSLPFSLSSTRPNTPNQNNNKLYSIDSHPEIVAEDSKIFATLSRSNSISQVTARKNSSEDNVQVKKLHFPKLSEELMTQAAELENPAGNIDHSKIQSVLFKAPPTEKLDNDDPPNIVVTSTPNKGKEDEKEENQDSNFCTPLPSKIPINSETVSKPSNVSQILPIDISWPDNDLLSIKTSVSQGTHTPFILNYSSKSIAEQLTLIERDALNEVDWRELVDIQASNNWQKINSMIFKKGENQSWLKFLINYFQLKPVDTQNEACSSRSGIQIVISRFNLTVEWVKSEILLTKSYKLRALTISKFIHVAHYCRNIQNYSTMMQIVLALSSWLVEYDEDIEFDECEELDQQELSINSPVALSSSRSSNSIANKHSSPKKRKRLLKKTWAHVSATDKQMLKTLKQLCSPLRNFQQLRVEMDQILSRQSAPTTAPNTTSTNLSKNRHLLSSQQQQPVGCIPFLGLFLNDLTFNAERPKYISSNTTAYKPSLKPQSSTSNNKKQNNHHHHHQVPTKDALINFERFKTTAKIIKSLLQYIEISVSNPSVSAYGYTFEPNHNLLSKCLYLSCLSESEMNKCFEYWDN